MGMDGDLDAYPPAASGRSTLPCVSLQVERHVDIGYAYGM